MFSFRASPCRTEGCHCSRRTSVSQSANAFVFTGDSRHTRFAGDPRRGTLARRARYARGESPRQRLRRLGDASKAAPEPDASGPPDVALCAIALRAPRHSRPTQLTCSRAHELQHALRRTYAPRSRHASHTRVDTSVWTHELRSTRASEYARFGAHEPSRCPLSASIGTSSGTAGTDGHGHGHGRARTRVVRATRDGSSVSRPRPRPGRRCSR